MKMDKMFAGLVAFVAGVALSAGSAAADGYMVGDPAMMKLVPYYDTGDTKATIIGIQNMSPQEDSTEKTHAAVDDAQTLVDAHDDTTDLDTVADNEKALADAQDAVYTEHVFVTVNAYDAAGMMMGTAMLCLAENQFGYVILQGPERQDWQEDIPHRSALLSAMDGDIHESGYVKVMAGDKKYTGCEVTSPDGLTGVDTSDSADIANDNNNVYTGADSKVAAWTIIQDVGDGFFGTEVPTATITMADTDADMDTDDVIACYGTAEAPSDSGTFVMANCGLIPERNTSKTGDIRNTDGTLSSGFSDNTTAYARYDAGDESMVYVWLAAGGDMDDTLPSDRRMLDVTVLCEDGMMQQASDIDGNLEPIKIPAPGMLTMIDPNMGDLGMATAMCSGDRGVLDITMPDGSHAGIVFTHITQMMGHYRMNFPGYSMVPMEVK